jgi:competence protein ComEA
MKYVWAGLAIVAAVAALFFRPPSGERGRALPPASNPGVGSVGVPLEAPTSGPERVGAHGGRPRPISARVVVYVAGEVNKPGVYAFASGARAQEALARAGGPKSDADLVAVNLAAPLDDGAEIAVPKIGEASTRGRRSAGPRARASHAPRGHGRRRRRNGRSEVAPVRSVDLNAAGASELETLPGLGPALAQRIVEYRDVNGPFTSVDELADVSGITAHLQEELANYLIVR